MYQLIILDAIGDKSAPLRSTVEQRVRELNLDPDTEFEFLGAGDLHCLRVDSLRVGVLFSGDQGCKKFALQVQALIDSPAVVIPVVTALEDFSLKVPEALKGTNGMKLDDKDPKLEKVAALVLELMGLMRKKRRLFISYKRTESAQAAQQLHHALDERSFDVFLDTLSVRSGDAFQEQLWHRMADSDIVILLYTASVLSSGWVKQEVQRANGMKITVLQLIWPDMTMKRDPTTEAFEAHYLTDNDFDSQHPETLTAQKTSEICILVESLRARSLANREAELIGTLRERASKHPLLETTVQPARFVDIKCDADTFVRVIPSVGVPDSEAFQTGALAPVDGVTPKEIVLFYDSLNVAKAWCEHLDWLHKYLPVKTVKISAVDQWLSTLCK